METTVIEQFHLLRPWWLLLLIPLAGTLWLLFKNRYDSGSWRAVIDARLLPFVLSAGGQNTRGWSRWVPGCVALLAIIALAGPTWEKLRQSVYQKE
jgi:Ca-activated chloride channel family protein